MGAIAKELPGRFSADEFLAFLETRPEKERWQLIDGAAVMMTPPTLIHQLIGLNLIERLNAALRTARPDLVALYEVGLKSQAFPDFLPTANVVVVDRPTDYSSYAGRVYLAAEVRSKSNTREFMRLKRERCVAHPDNLYAMIISQREMRLDMGARANRWERVRLAEPDTPIELPEFGFRCALRDLYRGTPLA